MIDKIYFDFNKYFNQPPITCKECKGTKRNENNK